MKTVAVLAALAAVATAVPALPGYGYERYRPAHYGLPAHYRREKKSPQELEINSAPAFNAAPAFEPVPEVAITAPADVLRTELDAAPETSARTFGLKKPIIVKKKFGYHLYRDSDEEQAQADPAEKCTKEVKVKLCDAEHLARSSDKMRSADEESNTPLTENEMKHSIKMAKEAVENLQKMSQFKNAELGPDAELHSDIEVARQALEHIQQNFGNLESMNLQATTLSDAEALQNARFKIAHTDSERMAQWKEAIENIQKNAELAKNIEDSFSSASETKVSVEDNDTTKKMKSSELVATSEDHKELTSMTKTIEEKTAEHDMPLKKEAEQEHVHEMLPSASEHTELKSALEEMPLKSNEASPKMDDEKAENLEKSANVEHIEQAKNTELESTLHVPASQIIEKSAHETAIKSNEFEDKKNAEKTVQPKTSDKIEDVSDLAPAQSAPVMHVVPAPAFDSHTAATNQRANTQEKSAWKETHINTLAKSNDNVAVNNDQKTEFKSHMEQEKSTIVDTTSLMKTAEQNIKQENLEQKIEQNNSQSKNAEEMIMKSAVNVEPASHSPMRSANSMSTAINNQEFQVEPKNWHEDKMTPKSGEVFHGDAEFERNAHHLNHGPHGFSTFAHSGATAHAHAGMHGKMEHMPFHGGQEMHGHGMHGQHFHGHQMHGMGFHGKTADTDSMVQATSQVNINDAGGKAAAEHNMQWKQKEGAARGAYGPGPYGAAGALNLAGAASGPGAVGVFPGANVGGCAIPLLLSCSPSVVPGSLAKTSYGAHAYRAEDGHFHRKRDTKKTNEIQTTKVKRTPTKVIQKIATEKKL